MLIQLNEVIINEDEIAAIYPGRYNTETIVLLKNGAEIIVKEKYEKIISYGKISAKFI